MPVPHCRNGSSRSLWAIICKFPQSILLKNEYINPNVFLIMWLLKFEVNFKIFLNFTITHSLFKTFLTISKKQKIPKTLFLAKFKKKKQNLKLPPSSFLSKTNLRYQFFDHLKWVVRYSICYYCVIYAHNSVYLIVFSARFFSILKEKNNTLCLQISHDRHWCDKRKNDKNPSKK